MYSSTRTDRRSIHSASAPRRNAGTPETTRAASAPSPPRATAPVPTHRARRHAAVVPVLSFGTKGATLMRSPFRRTWLEGSNGIEISTVAVAPSKTAAVSPSPSSAPGAPKVTPRRTHPARRSVSHALLIPSTPLIDATSPRTPGGSSLSMWRNSVPTPPHDNVAVRSAPLFNRQSSTIRTTRPAVSSTSDRLPVRIATS